MRLNRAKRAHLLACAVSVDGFIPYERFVALPEWATVEIVRQRIAEPVFNRYAMELIKWLH